MGRDGIVNISVIIFDHLLLIKDYFLIGIISAKVDLLKMYNIFLR